MNKWFESLFTAWTGVATHKLRSFLTILGIVIGVAAVIALMSIGRGAEVSIISGIQSLGSNLLFIQPGFTVQAGVRSATGSAITLTVEDAEAIAAEVQHVTCAAPIVGASQQLIAGAENLRARVTGITPAYQQALNLTVAQGEPINDEHYRSSAKVAVIGPNVSETLFRGGDPVGQTVRMGNSVVRIIGVLESKGTTAMGSMDDTVLIPLTTMRQTASYLRNFLGRNLVNSVIVQVSEQKYTQYVIGEITSLLRYRHRLTTADNDFTITSQEDMARALSQAMSNMTFLLASIAAISLLVGGIGVMNIMLVSVMERTREIGIRKALGAREMEITVQFLIEAALLTLTGGIIGVVLGWGASQVVSRTLSYTTLVSADIILLAFSISVAIGLFFGFYPAWHASRLKPVEALRYE